jgi:hypothetical protein
MKRKQVTIYPILKCFEKVIVLSILLLLFPFCHDKAGNIFKDDFFPLKKMQGINCTDNSVA